MFDWLQKTIGQHSSHPMNSPGEAARLLTELPLDEPLKAVEEVAAWLESLSHATSFNTESRLKVISMVDEAGQPCADLLMAEYLAGEARLETGRFRQWQALMDFWERLADAYQLIALQIEVSGRSELAEHSTLVAVRAMRAVFHQMRLSLMRYAGQLEGLWSALYRLYKFAHAQRRAAVPVRPYPWDTLSTTARLELARAVMLEAAAPQSLPPRQIDLTARISARQASSFAYSEKPGPQFPFYLDLDQARAPQPAPKDLQATPTMRFFGPGAAAVRVKELLGNETGTDRFGDEFTASEKTETLQRLLLYWSDHPPRRQHNRARLNLGVDVAFGLEEIRRLLSPTDQMAVAEESEKFKVELDSGELGVREPAVAKVETWKLMNISLRGLGAVTHRRALGSLKIGALIAFRLQGTDKWGVGIVRRLQIDGQNNSHIGAEIFSKRPQLLHLKKLGYKQDEAWNWEARDQKSLQQLTQAVLLPADAAAAIKASLLFAPESHFPEEAFGLLIDGKPRKLQVGQVIEKGDGFERVAFQWQAVQAPPSETAPASPQSSGFSDQPLE